MAALGNETAVVMMRQCGGAAEAALAEEEEEGGSTSRGYHHAGALILFLAASFQEGGEVEIHQLPGKHRRRGRRCCAPRAQARLDLGAEQFFVAETRRGNRCCCSNNARGPGLDRGSHDGGGRCKRRQLDLLGFSGALRLVVGLRGGNGRSQRLAAERAHAAALRLTKDAGGAGLAHDVRAPQPWRLWRNGCIEAHATERCVFGLADGDARHRSRRILRLVGSGSRPRLGPSQRHSGINIPRRGGSLRDATRNGGGDGGVRVIAPTPTHQDDAGDEGDDADNRQSVEGEQNL